MAKTGFAVAFPLAIDEMVDVAKAAEARGYDSFWLTEASGGRDATVQLAHIGAQTTSIKLGTGILTLYCRTATATAQASASVAEISGGRFILGLGTGHKAGVEQTQGTPFSKPVTRMRDYIQIIRTAWDEGNVSYEGGAVSIPGMRMSTPAPGRLPIYVACLGGPLAELAGEMADGVLPLMASPEGIGELRQHIEAGAKKTGRDPSAIDVACFIIAAAGGDGAAVERTARANVSMYAGAPFYQKMLRLSGFEKEVETFVEAQEAGDARKIRDLVSDRMLEALTLTGEPSRWKATLDRFRAAGVTNPIVYAAPVGDDRKGSLVEAVNALTAADLG